MKPYHKNPRTITDREQADLARWLDELGDLSGIVHDLNSDETICGNQRVDVMNLLDATPVITERFDPPTRQGTVALGYFEKHGERYAYRAVRWTEKQCEKANIVANSAGGDWDIEILTGWDGEELEEWGMDEETLAEILAQIDKEESQNNSNNESDGSLLSLTDVTIEAPTHVVANGEVWSLGNHILVVCDVISDWKTWYEYLDLSDNSIFVPYPGPFVVLGNRALKQKMVMIQPDIYIAGHILDRYVEINGENSIGKKDTGQL